MAKNILIIFLILVFLCVTMLICIFRPKTHKPIVFENRKFTLALMSQKAENEPVNVSVEVETPKIDIPELPKIETPKIENKKSVKSQTSAIQSQKTKTSQTKVQKSEEKPTISQKPVTQKPQKPAQSQINTQQNEKQIKTPVKQETTEKKEVVTKSVLTQEEIEVIEWNRWRSELQNKLMKDSKIAAPVGTSFNFSFTVDKFGNISNLKTWSNNPSYTPLAVRNIKPLLLSYQQTAILKFPEKSKRVITNVSGGFTMARSS